MQLPLGVAKHKRMGMAAKIHDSLRFEDGWILGLQPFVTCNLVPDLVLTFEWHDALQNTNSKTQHTVLYQTMCNSLYHGHVCGVCRCCSHAAAGSITMGSHQLCQRLHQTQDCLQVSCHVKR